MKQQEFLTQRSSEAAKLAPRLQRASEVRAVREFNKLPAVYSQYLSSSLKERLVAAGEHFATQSRLCLDNELDLVRDTVLGEALLYDKACFVCDAAKHSDDERIKSAALEARIESGMRLRVAINSVAELCERMAKMDAASKAAIPSAAVNFVVMQVAQIAKDVLPASQAQLLADRLRSVRISDIEAGTMRTPDMDADEMDATVPFALEHTSQQQVG